MFAMDTLNTGNSGLLPSALVTVDLNALTIHDVIEALRTGTAGGHAYSRITVIAHSLGSEGSIVEASTYNDEDGLVLTGFSHYPEPGLFTDVLGGQLAEPPQLDPNPRLQGHPLGDVKTEPGGARSDLFYAPGTSHPAVQ